MLKIEAIQIAKFKFVVNNCIVYITAVVQSGLYFTTELYICTWISFFYYVNLTHLFFFLGQIDEQANK